VKIGRWEPVDIRQVWARENAEFTPWLSENIEELARVLGLDLQIDRTEVPVGDFKLDILAHEESSQRTVVIENQFGKTDHDHLGKLLTYASGVEASVLVWLVEEFRDEHRAALDWLNSHLGEDVQIFGVKLEARRIGSSDPAPVFDIVCSPNGWARDQKQKAVAAARSSRGEVYREFWQTLLPDLRERGVSNLRAAQPDNWMDVPSGVTGIPIQLAFGHGGRTARGLLYIAPGDEEFNRRVFEILQKDQSTIEHKLGPGLIWDTKQGRKYSSIGLTRDADILDKSQWPAVGEWMVNTVLGLRSVFSPEYLNNALSEAYSDPNSSETDG